jgi:RNA polymerase-binding transcription factor DksA
MIQFLYMDTNSYKARLEEEKMRLEKELQTVGRRNPSNPNDWEAVPSETGQEADPNDQADQMENYGENAAILDDLEIRYNEVKDALGLIDAGTYGTCETCGEAIEPERLEADPAARTCKQHLNA